MSPTPIFSSTCYRDYLGLSIPRGYLLGGTSTARKQSESRKSQNCFVWWMQSTLIWQWLRPLTRCGSSLWIFSLDRPLKMSLVVALTFFSAGWKVRQMTGWGYSQIEPVNSAHESQCTESCGRTIEHRGISPIHDDSKHPQNPAYSK